VRHFFCKALQSYNSPAARAGELSKPPADSESLPVEIEKIYFYFLVWGYLGETSQVGVFLRFFGHLYPALGANPLSHFWLKFVWKLGQNPRL